MQEAGKVLRTQNHIWNTGRKSGKYSRTYPINTSHRDITILQPLAIATEIAMQSVAIVRVHYNEGTWTGGTVSCTYLASFQGFICSIMWPCTSVIQRFCYGERHVNLPWGGPTKE